MQSIQIFQIFAGLEHRKETIDIVLPKELFHYFPNVALSKGKGKKKSIISYLHDDERR
jgi:hypothetical protein